MLQLRHILHGNCTQCSKGPAWLSWGKRITPSKQPSLTWLHHPVSGRRALEPAGEARRVGSPKRAGDDHHGKLQGESSRELQEWLLQVYNFEIGVQLLINLCSGLVTSTTCHWLVQQVKRLGAISRISLTCWMRYQSSGDLFCSKMLPLTVFVIRSKYFFLTIHFLPVKRCLGGRSLFCMRRF